MAAFFGLAESPASASASEGPVAAYSFDEGEGTSAEDVTGAGHDGTIESATWTNGKYGSALKFDGENDCVTVPESPDFELTEEFTLEAWVKPEGPLGEDPVISKQAEGEDSYGFGIAFFAGGRAEGFIGEGEEAYKYVSSSEAIEPKAWTHIAFTYDGAHMRIYVNGELTGTHAMSQAPLPSSGPLTIGCDEAFGEHFQGKIDEVRVYDRALNADNLAADKSAPIQTPQQGPIAAYSFDEGEGTSAEDVSGNGHTATLEGATWARGRYGSGLEFNGTSSCVSIAAASDLQLTEEFTLEAWVRPTGAGEEANPFLTMEDEAAGPEEEPYAYTFLAGENEVPKAWVRKSGEEGFQGIYGTEPLPEHAWAHLALTDDGAKLRLYVNGELVRTTEAPEATAATGPLTIGCDKLFPAYFEGRIDEVRIYNRVLGESEVQADKSAPIQIPQQGPVAAYSFDEGEGETAEDQAGENDGTIEGAEWTRGKYGDALYFDGEEDQVTIPDAEALDLSEEFTLEAWVKPAEESEWGPILSKEDGGETPAYLFYAQGYGTPQALVYDAEHEKAIGAPDPLTPHAWSHVAVTYDGAKLRLYVDGELVETAAGLDAKTTSGPLEIGKSAFGEHFKGKIDELKLYNCALDEAEVQADKSAPIQTPQQGPVAAYSFDEGEGTTAEDVTGDAHTATLEGATWARGRYGDGLEFNGTSSCVSIAAASELQLTEEFTLEAWVRPTGSGPEANPFLTMEDEAAGEEEEPFAYTFLAGENEVPKAWVRKSGEEGFQGIYGTEPLPEHAWAHLALTDDGAHLRLYVDGELVRTTAAPEATAASGPLKVGCGPFGGHFEGRIDEVRIYNRALDEGEVQGDKSAPIQTPQQGPVAAYSFDEGEGETAEDVTGNGHTATLEGATWARGKYGSGLSFDGENDCVSIEASEDLQFTEEFTLEAWVRPEGEGEEALPVIAMADSEAGPGEEEFAYELLAGQNEVPKGWVRKGGASGFQSIAGTEALPEKAWDHISLTDDGAHLRLYVNGELVRTTAAPNLTTASGPLQIGCEPYAHYWGRIDEVRIYNRVLGEGEIEPDLTGPTQPTGLYASLEGGSASVTWNWSIDPPKESGSPGSGVLDYAYRFQREAAAWSSWQTTEIPAFQIPEAKSGEEIRVTIYAVDREGNPSPIDYAKLQVTMPSLTPEDYGSSVGSGPVDIDPEPASNEEEPSEGTYKPLRSNRSPIPFDASEERLCKGTGENPCGYYDGFEAGSYAQKWHLEGETDEEAEENHNQSFRYEGGRGGDCTNFVSQALHAGGMLYMRAEGFDSANAIHEGQNEVSAYQHGQGAWWSLYADLSLGGRVQRYYDFTRAWAGAYGLYEHLTEYSLGHMLGPNEPIERGDVLFYSEGGELKPAEISHSQIVSRIDKNGIWVAQHSKNYEHRLGYVIKRLKTEEHETLGKDYEIYYFRPDYAAANIG